MGCIKDYLRLAKLRQRTLKFNGNINEFEAHYDLIVNFGRTLTSEEKSEVIKVSVLKENGNLEDYDVLCLDTEYRVVTKYYDNTDCLNAYLLVSEYNTTILVTPLVLKNFILHGGRVRNIKLRPNGNIVTTTNVNTEIH